MKKLICECCGSNDIIKISRDLYMCQSCGVKYRNDDIASLLVDVVEQTVNRNLPKLDELLNNALRSLKSGSWEKASRFAEDALKIDSNHPEALLYAGVAAGMAKPYHAYQTVIYARDAVASKRQREEADLYEFVSQALDWSWRVCQTGLEKLVKGSYSSSFAEFQKESAQQRVEENERDFRRAVTRGEKYYGRSNSPGLVDTAFDALLARNEASAVRKQYMDAVAPELQKLTDDVLALDVLRLNDTGIQALAHLLTLRFQTKTTLSYNHRAEQKQELEALRGKAIQLQQLTANVATKQELGKVVANLDNSLADIARWDRNGPPGAVLSKGEMIFYNAFFLVPILSPVVFFGGVYAPYRKMMKSGFVEYSGLAEAIPFTEALREKRRKQVKISAILTAIGNSFWLAILLIMLILILVRGYVY